MLRRPPICFSSLSFPHHRKICTTSVCHQSGYVTDFRNKPKIKPVTDARKGEPNYFENEALKLQPAPGYIDRLCEIWFDKMSSQRDLTFKSGKFCGFCSVAMIWLLFDFQLINLLGSMQKSRKIIFRKLTKRSRE